MPATKLTRIRRVAAPTYSQGPRIILARRVTQATSLTVVAAEPSRECGMGHRDPMGFIWKMSKRTGNKNKDAAV